MKALIVPSMSPVTIIQGAVFSQRSSKYPTRIPPTMFDEMIAPAEKASASFDCSDLSLIHHFLVGCGEGVGNRCIPIIRWRTSGGNCCKAFSNSLPVNGRLTESGTAPGTPGFAAACLRTGSGVGDGVLRTSALGCGVAAFDRAGAAFAGGDEESETALLLPPPQAEKTTGRITAKTKQTFKRKLR